MFSFLHTRGFVVALSFGLLGLLPGCGPGTSDKIEVRGTVTLDGVPLANGAVSFLLPNGAAVAGAPIKDGVFVVRVMPGPHKVSITASREVPGKTVPGMDSPVYESIVPARYNTQTTLTADVGPDRTEFTFPLESRPAKGKK